MVSHTDLWGAQVMETGIVCTLFSENLPSVIERKIYLMSGRFWQCAHDPTHKICLFPPRKDADVGLLLFTHTMKNTGEHRAFSGSLCYYTGLLLGGITHSMLPGKQELLDMLRNGCTCVYSAGTAFAVRMGTRVVPSTASRGNKSVQPV